MPKVVQGTAEQHRRFRDFIMGDDLDFYERFVINLSDVEQAKFFTEVPDFMSEFSIGYDKIYLLKDRLFRGILRKIRLCEKERENANFKNEKEI